MAKQSATEPPAPSSVFPVTWSLESVRSLHLKRQRRDISRRTSVYALLARRESLLFPWQNRTDPCDSACPIAGAASFSFSAHHNITRLHTTDLVKGSDGYECLDTKTSLESCGGCSSAGQGEDCTKIANTLGVGVSLVSALRRTQLMVQPVLRGFLHHSVLQVWLRAIKGWKIMSTNIDESLKLRRRGEAKAQAQGKWTP